MAPRNLPPWALSRRRKQRLRLLRRGLMVVLVVAAGLTPLAWSTGARDGPPQAERLPRVLNGGQAWGGFEAPPAATPPSATAATARTLGPAAVTHVRDGDTIELGALALRLATLDCAELGTAEGARAKARMEALVRGARLTCRLTGEVSYDRQIASCQLPGGRDLAAAMIADGTCRARL